MIAFERYLLENGYKKYRMDFSNKQNPTLEETNTSSYSTMGDIHYYYIHENDTEKENIITCGLNQKDNPATLIHPRPIVRWEKHYSCQYSDKIMERILKDQPFDIVLKSILDNSPDITKDTIIFEYNFLEEGI